MAQQRDNREDAREEMGRTGSEIAERAQRSVERLENAFGAFWEEAAGDGAQPFVKQAAQANMELIQLAGRRARAAAELPARLVACRSPQEAWAEQMHFLKDMFADYQSATGRLVDALTDTVISQGRQTMGSGEHRQSSNGHGQERRSR